MFNALDSQHLVRNVLSKICVKKFLKILDQTEENMFLLHFLVLLNFIFRCSEIFLTVICNRSRSALVTEALVVLVEWARLIRGLIICFFFASYLLELLTLC